MSVLTGSIAFASFVISCLVVWRLVRRPLTIDTPNARSSHTNPVPRGGGLAIALVTLLAIISLIALTQPSAFLLSLLAGGVLIATISFIDDMRGLSAPPRLAVQFLAAAAPAYLFGGHLVQRTTPLPFAAGVAIAAIFIVGLTNAYNFMDGIDGIAATQAVVAGCGWIALAAIHPATDLSTIAAAVVASSAAFLLFNWAPAKIFMGDVGSAFLGFVLATLPVAAGVTSPSAAVAGVLFVWPFIFDSSLTFVRRALNRENVFAAHRSHLYQRLVISGLSHAAVTLLYGALALFGTALGLAVVSSKMSWAAALAGVAIAAALLFVFASWRERNGRLAAVERQAR